MEHCTGTLKRLNHDSGTNAVGYEMSALLYLPKGMSSSTLPLLNDQSVHIAADTSGVFLPRQSTAPPYHSAEGGVFVRLGMVSENLMVVRPMRAEQLNLNRHILYAKRNNHASGFRPPSDTIADIDDPTSHLGFRTPRTLGDLKASNHVSPPMGYRSRECGQLRRGTL